MTGSFSISCEAEIKLKLPEFIVTAHIFTPFHVTSQKIITVQFLAEIYFKNLELK